MNSITQCSDSLNNSGLAFSFSFFKPLLTHPFLRTVQLRTVYDQKKKKKTPGSDPGIAARMTMSNSCCGLGDGRAR